MRMGLTLEPSRDLSSDVLGAPVVVVSAAMLLLAYFPTGAPSIHSGAAVHLAHCVPGTVFPECGGEGLWEEPISSSFTSPWYEEVGGGKGDGYCHWLQGNSSTPTGNASQFPSAEMKLVAT